MDDRYNLVYNGDFSHGADGWRTTSVFTVNTAVTYNGSCGSLNGQGNVWDTINEHAIQINTADTYVFEFDVMSTASASSWNYSYLPVFDKYGVNLMVSELTHYGDSTLAVELKNGDTTATVANAAGFYENIKSNYNTFGIADSPAWGYNRRMYGQRMVASATNTSTNVITLAAAWTGGTWKVGTPVARYRDGGTYIYPASWNSMPLNQWIHKSFSLTPSYSWRFTAVSMIIGQSVATNWQTYYTNFKLTNTSRPQEREYNGTQQTGGSGFASIEKTGIAEGSSVHETATQNARYIRDWLSGNTVNGDSHWCEIQAWDKYGRNVAFASNVSAYTSNGTAINLLLYKSGVNNSSNANYNKGHAITKGNHSPYTTYAYFLATNGMGYIDIDLGQVFELEKIQIWHYWGDGRTYYKTKTQISEDRANWKTVFDSDVNGRYSETSAGLTITFNETNMSITNAGIYKTNALYEI